MVLPWKSEHARAAPNAQPQSGIVWLASYPKSGNTWARAFLHNLLSTISGPSRPQEINALGRYTGGLSGKDLFANVLGYEPTAEHRKQIAAVRHEVQRRAADQVEGLLFVKTHQALAVDRGFTTINFEVTAGVIYILRNPLDVAISYSHHLGCTIDEAITIMGTNDVEMAVTDKQVHELCGSWSQNVLSWTRKPQQAVFVMRYEDMLSKPEATFGALARHLLIVPSRDELAEAIKHSSFDELSAQEEKDGFRERPKQASRFFREGRTGQWKEILTQQQIDRIIKDHSEQMARFGYLPEQQEAGGPRR